MLRHADVWGAIDALARHYGLSASGLARRAGLDPTTFNKSKRITRDGKPRWPSTESLSKILRATGATLEDFVAFIKNDDGGGLSRRLPVVVVGRAGDPALFDETGRPERAKWEECLFPELGDPHAYAVEIEGDGFAPIYRDGDLIVVSPFAGVRRGDRVVVRMKSGDVLIARLRRKSMQRIELDALANGEAMPDQRADDVATIHRVVWSRQ